MKKTLAALVVLTCLSVINAQTSETKASGDASANAAATVNKKAIQLESSTRFAAQLQNSLDVRKAKVGDQVVLRTTEAIKSQGRTVVPKGARLVGQVTEVAQRAGSNSESRIGLLFDRLERCDLVMPISATITSITSARGNTGNDDGFASSSASSSTQASASNPGVVGAVGGLAGTTTSTVGTSVAARHPQLERSTQQPARPDQLLGTQLNHFAKPAAPLFPAVQRCQFRVGISALKKEPISTLS